MAKPIWTKRGRSVISSRHKFFPHEKTINTIKSRIYSSLPRHLHSLIITLMKITAMVMDIKVFFFKKHDSSDGSSDELFEVLLNFEN